MLPHVIAWAQDLFETEEEGQGLVEYALIIVLVSIVCMAMLRALGVQIGAIFDRISAILLAG